MWEDKCLSSDLWLVSTITYSSQILCTMAHNSILHGRSGPQGSSDTMRHIRLFVDKLENFSCNEGMCQTGFFFSLHRVASHQAVRTVSQQAKTGVSEWKGNLIWHLIWPSQLKISKWFTFFSAFILTMNLWDRRQSPCLMELCYSKVKMHLTFTRQEPAVDLLY